MKVTKVTGLNGLQYWQIHLGYRLSWSEDYAMLQWCTEQFGPIRYSMPLVGGQGWSRAISEIDSTYLFTSKDDLTLFKLRWDK